MNIKDLTQEEFNNFVYDYYNSDQSIKKVLEKYNVTDISMQKVIDILPYIETSDNCEYCNLKMVYLQKNKTAYKENFKYSDKICLKCNHRISSHGFGLKNCNCDNCIVLKKEIQKKQDSLKLKALTQLIKKTEKSAIKFDDLKYLSLPIKTYLLTFLTQIAS